MRGSSRKIATIVLLLMFVVLGGVGIYISTRLAGDSTAAQNSNAATCLGICIAECEQSGDIATCATQCEASCNQDIAAAGDAVQALQDYVATISEDSSREERAMIFMNTLIPTTKCEDITSKADLKEILGSTISVTELKTAPQELVRFTSNFTKEDIILTVRPQRFCIFTNNTETVTVGLYTNYDLQENGDYLFMNLSEVSDAYLDKIVTTEKDNASVVLDTEFGQLLDSSDELSTTTCAATFLDPGRTIKYGVVYYTSAEGTDCVSKFKTTSNNLVKTIRGNLLNMLSDGSLWEKLDK